MNIRNRVGLVALSLILGVGALDPASRLAIPGLTGYVSRAEAVVGRPLTPVSVAGVGRRTVRRCAVGVYNC